MPLLDFAGTILIVASVVLTINVCVSILQAPPPWKIAGALTIGLWIGTVVALASSGAFDDAGRRTIPLIGVMVLLPLLAAGMAALLFPAFRAVLLALPLPLLVGLHTTRLVGAFFLLLAASGRLGGPFPYSAGWGDVITGALAIPIAILATHKTRDSLVWLWNGFGALDLVAAVTLGVLSAPGSAFQLFNIGAKAATMSAAPWAMIPAVLVPFYLIMHAVVFAQLRARSAKALRFQAS